MRIVWATGVRVQVGRGGENLSRLEFMIVVSRVKTLVSTHGKVSVFVPGMVLEQHFRPTTQRIVLGEVFSMPVENLRFY